MFIPLKFFTQANHAHSSHDQKRQPAVMCTEHIHVYTHITYTLYRCVSTLFPPSSATVRPITSVGLRSVHQWLLYPCSFVTEFPLPFAAPLWGLRSVTQNQFTCGPSLEGTFTPDSLSNAGKT